MHPTMHLTSIRSITLRLRNCNNTVIFHVKFTDCFFFAFNDIVDRDQVFHRFKSLLKFHIDFLFVDFSHKGRHKGRCN